MNSSKYVLSARQKQLVKNEVKRLIPDVSEEHFSNTIATFLYALHLYTGWKQKKLYDFYVQFDVLHKELLDYYQLDTHEDGWLCKLKLKELGVDVDEWIEKDKQNSK